MEIPWLFTILLHLGYITFEGFLSNHGLIVSIDNRPCQLSVAPLEIVMREYMQIDSLEDKFEYVTLKINLIDYLIKDFSLTAVNSIWQGGHLFAHSLTMYRC